MTRRNGVVLPAHSAYADREYRSARRELTAHPETPCVYCGRSATTLDHVPALARHVHVRGSGCCETVPACRRCNMGAGGRLAGRRRRAKAEARRVAGASREW